MMLVKISKVRIHSYKFISNLENADSKALGNRNFVVLQYTLPFYSPFPVPLQLELKAFPSLANLNCKLSLTQSSPATAQRKKLLLYSSPYSRFPAPLQPCQHKVVLTIQGNHYDFQYISKIHKSGGERGECGDKSFCTKPERISSIWRQYEPDTFLKRNNKWNIRTNKISHTSSQ